MRIPDTPDPDTTLELLWERIRRRGDLPGFTKAISVVLDAMHGEDEQEHNMTQTVMSDPGLTQKVLRLAGAYAGMLGVDAAAVLKAAESAKMSAESELGAVHSAKRSNTEKRSRAALAEPAARGILLEGVSEMRGIVHSASPSQMMTMGLETLYQGLSFRRAIAFLRNVKEAKYSARMGFGAGVSALIPQLVFNDAYRPDVFHAALVSDRVIFAENAHEPKFAAKLPRWWQHSLSAATSFIIVPLTINRQPAGFIYGDWGDTAPSAKPSPTEFIILNDLRALVAQTAERHHAMASSSAAATH